MNAALRAIKDRVTGAILKKVPSVLSMNQRNLLYVYPSNERRHYPIADDKLLTKKVLGKAGIPMPKTFSVYSNFFELSAFEKDLAAYDDFVIKPARGRGGGGIIAITGRGEDGGWRGAGGGVYETAYFRKHISDIIFGVYSFDLTDSAIIEERLVLQDEMQSLSPFGLADVRIIIYRDEPVMSMMRVPTTSSEGKANLHQGALGVGVELITGQTVRAFLKGQEVEEHPDTGVRLVGRQIPHWDEVVEIACAASRAVPLDYLGVDIAVSNRGPVLLEINVRPGIEIQNINRAGLRSILEDVER